MTLAKRIGQVCMKCVIKIAFSILTFLDHVILGLGLPRPEQRKVMS